MGYSFRMQDDLSAVPGLRLYLDARYGVEKMQVGAPNNVTKWSDLISGQPFGEIGAESSPIQSSPPFMSYAYGGSGGYQKRLAVINQEFKNTFDFLHKLTPYGVYWIYNCANVDATYGPLQTGNPGAARGIYIERQGADFPRYRIRILDGSGATLLQMFTSFANADGRNEATNFWSLFCQGNSTTNGLQLRRANTILTQSNIGSISNDGAPTYLRVNGENSNSETLGTPSLNYGLIIVYDWNGYTLSEINAFDSRVRSLLSAILPNFV